MGQSTPTPYVDFNLKSFGVNLSAVPNQCHVVPPAALTYELPKLSGPPFKNIYPVLLSMERVHTLSECMEYQLICSEFADKF